MIYLLLNTAALSFVTSLAIFAVLEVLKANG